MLSPNQLRTDPSNPQLTIPRSYGVWEVPCTSGKQYRYGNNPVREQELENEFGRVKRIGLYENRELAKAQADNLNRH
jgi:hypothetical protein